MDLGRLAERLPGRSLEGVPVRRGRWMIRARAGSAVLIVFWLLMAAGCRDVRAPVGASTETGTSPNVVVVALDAARADHFGAWGYGRDTTPRIDAFAAGATRYSRVMSEASYTFLSTSSLFTGASPAETGLGARSGGCLLYTSDAADD